MKIVYVIGSFILIGFYIICFTNNFASLNKVITFDQKEKTLNEKVELAENHLLPEIISEIKNKSNYQVYKTNTQPVRNKKPFLKLKPVNVNYINTTYYVANSGNDSANGLTPETAWKTLDKVSNTAIKSGDIIALNGGDEFIENLKIREKKGTINTPIIITSYGNGKAIIKGSREISDWHNREKNIWEASVKDNNIYKVLKNGIGTINARIPDLSTPEDNSSNYLYTTSVLDKHSEFTCKELIGHSDLVGATVFFRTLPFEREARKISAFDQATGRITLQQPTNGKLSVGKDFYIQNHFNLLTTSGEWFFDNISRKLYIYSKNSPINIDVVTKKDSGIHLVNNYGSYIQLENLEVRDFVDAGIKIQESSNTIVKNVTINECLLSGIWLLSSNNVKLINSEISNISYKGILLEDSDSAIIENNKIKNNSLLKNCSIHQKSQGPAIYISYHSKNATISKNNISTCGYGGIYFFDVVNILVEKNYIENVGLNMEDGAGIYGSSGKNSINNKIDRNIIIGYNFMDPYWDINGIYIDDDGHDFTITNNGIQGFRKSIFMHNAKDCIIANNNFYNPTSINIHVKNDNLSKTESVNITLDSNYVYSNNLEYPCLKIENTLDSSFTQIVSGGNNKYFNPNQFNSVQLKVKNQNSSYTISDWKLKSGIDKNSSDDTNFSISNSKILYNNSNSSKLFSLKGHWKDLNGTVFVNSITLNGYMSKILIQE